MIDQLILRLKLFLANFASQKILRIRRVNLLVNSQNRFCLHLQSANVAIKLSLGRVYVREMRVEICFSRERFVAELAVKVRFLHVNVLDVMAKAEDARVASIAVSAEVNVLFFVGQVRVPMCREMSRFLERFSAFAREFSVFAFVVSTVMCHAVIVVVRLCLVAFTAVCTAEVGGVYDVVLVVIHERFGGTDEAAAFAGNPWKAIVSGLSVRCEKIHLLESFVADVAGKAVKGMRKKSK
jgi:hypothetical protein